MPSVRKEDENVRKSRSNAVTLDLSGRGLQMIEPLPEGISPLTIIYNNNNISRIENLQYFAHLQQLSLADNHLVEMSGISQAQGLKVLDLSNNSIITIEGLTHLRSLEWVNLSGNSIKRIQNLERNINLHHLDLSDNSIVKITNLRNLTKLKVLLLHGNLITSLKNMAENVCESNIVTLSLAENEISDLNELYYLRSLTSLEQLSIVGNPCLLALPTLSYWAYSGFNYRPYILYNCQQLHNLDGHLISQSDRLDADRLRRDGKMRTFSPGRHPQLLTYLSQATPLRPSSAKAPPTPNIDRISSNASSMPHDDQKWSVPVLDDKHSTEARDLALEDVSQSESDDQLESESCYLPVDSSLLPSTYHYYDRGSEDWYTTEVNRVSHHDNHINNWSLDIEKKNGVGVPVDRDPCMVKDRIGSQAQGIEDAVAGNQDYEAEPPIMTEEEAFDLIHLAATIIQAHVRGFLVRQKLNFHVYRRKNQAAALIQATWKGYRTRMYNVKVVTVRNEIRNRRLTAHVNHLASLVVRCQEQAAKDKRTMAKAIKCLWNELEKQNDRNVARLTREQNKAAVMIQRTWKGYQARKTYPLHKRTRLQTYQSMAILCQDLQKQIDILKSEVQDLKSEKSRRESVGDSSRPRKLDRVKSTPEIRIIRPSICILPEHQFDINESIERERTAQGLVSDKDDGEVDPLRQLHTNEPIKCKRSVEELMNDEDDVEVEPLDLGKYDALSDVRETTFDIGTTLDSKDEVTTNSSKWKSNDDERVGEGIQDSSENDHDEGGSSNYALSDFSTPEEIKSNNRVSSGEESEEIPNKDEKREERDSEENEKSSIEYRLNKEDKVILNENFENIFSEDVGSVGNINCDEKSDVSNVVSLNDDIEERKESVEITSGDDVEKASIMDREEQQKTTPSFFHGQQELADTSTTSHVNLKTNENDKKEKKEIFETDSTFILSQTDSSPSKTADDSTSDGSPGSSPKPEGVVGRKKKKLLLRSSSAEAMPRIRSFHSAHSLDSEELSSSLNFSSRLGQRTAALLLELRSEIASLTARQLSDNDFDNPNPDDVTTGQVTAASNTEVNSNASNDPTTVTIKNTREPLSSTTSDSIIDVRTDERKSLQSDSGISCQEAKDSESKETVHSNDSVDVLQGLGKDLNTTTVLTTSSQQDSEENVVDKTLGKNSSSVNVNESGGQEKPGHEHSEISQSNVDVMKTSPRSSAISMPMFEDTDKRSFSLDDFMEDSLDHSDDD